MRPVKAGILRLVLLGAATSLVLAGCGHDTTPADGSSPSAGASTSPAGSGSGDGTTTPGTGSGTGSGQGSGQSTQSGSPSASPSASGSSGGSDGSSSGTTGDGTGAGLEVPEAAPETVDSLSELLGSMDSRPLVTAPLPRPASARGRLVGGFPTVLRPTSASRVVTSGISPSGDRLQVGLVASSRLSVTEVLLAYRTRLGKRGVVELADPPTTAGSVAGSFRRQGSRITITATSEGSRTTYSIHATLVAGGE
ncbi:hypothetical protein [Nocardioides exalbidus]|nr:hypothetical protein [Nocardioides exalbidus]